MDPTHGRVGHKWLFLTTRDVMQAVPPYYVLPTHIEVCYTCFAVRGHNEAGVFLIRAGVEQGPGGQCLD